MEETLFTATGRRRTRGRVRRGLDTDIGEARSSDARIAAAHVATLRVMADRIDQLEHKLEAPTSKPYDHLPLASLLREFREAYTEAFAALARAEDPLTHALAAFLEHDRNASSGDAPGPHAA